MKKDMNKKAYIFFNCDEHESVASMNPHYNKIAYRDVRDGRRALWDKIKEEMEAERIVISPDSHKAIRQAVLFGNPIEANQHMTFGHIISADLIG